MIKKGRQQERKRGKNKDRMEDKQKKNNVSSAGIVKRMATEVEGRSIKEINNLTQMKKEKTEKQKIRNRLILHVGNT